jgi:CDP-glycerol glycerophosphotransferase (TagB/SpsB family)
MRGERRGTASDVRQVPSGGRREAPALATRMIGTLDRLLPVKSGVVVRTAPDFDDQGLAMCEQLVGDGRKVVWLAAEDDADRLRRLAPELSEGVQVLPARSVRGIAAYLRAKTVIHTHGLYQVPSRSRRKLFVNLWHGMPVKRLTQEPGVAARQTDVLTVTSDLHGRHIADSWQLDPAKVHVTGLPRNDRMVRASTRARPETLAQRVGDRPLVVWLPTYRESVTGEIRRDGTEFGNAFELPGATVDSVAELAGRLGVHLVVKLHPMSPRRSLGEHGDLSVWDERALDEHRVTLYELLGHADVLVTDHSSVWVDYLLLDRPMVFSIADLDAYATTRGHYFAPLEEHLPGPVVSDLGALGATLSQVMHDAETVARWAATRAGLRPVHHRWLDDGSAERVAALCQGA